MAPACGAFDPRKAGGLGTGPPERLACCCWPGASIRIARAADGLRSSSHSSHIRRTALELKAACEPYRNTTSPVTWSRLDSRAVGAEGRATSSCGYRTASSCAISMVWSVEPSSTTRTSNRSVKSERISKMCWRLSLRVRSALQTGSTTLRERFTSNPFQNDVDIDLLCQGGGGIVSEDESAHPAPQPRDARMRFLSGCRHSRRVSREDALGFWSARFMAPATPAWWARQPDCATGRENWWGWGTVSHRHCSWRW